MKLVRAVVFWIHFTLGCAAGLVILAMSLTGVLLAFERQINGWADAPPALRDASATTVRQPLDGMVNALASSGQGLPSQLVVHREPQTPVEARYGREKTLYLNPATGAVVGQPSARSRAFFGATERIHRSLGMGMQSAFGRGLTDAGNLIFLFMLVSGLYLWLPRVFNAVNLKVRLLFRPNASGRAREWNWHHVFGIWTAVPLVFIVASGVVMSYPWASNLLYTMTGSQPPVQGGRGDRPGPGGGPGAMATSGAGPRDGAARGRDTERAPGRETGRDRGVADGRGRPERPAAPSAVLGLDLAAQAAGGLVPGWRSIAIDVPREQDGSVNAAVDTSVGGQPEKVTQLVVNRQSGQVERIKRFHENATGRRLRAAATGVCTVCTHGRRVRHRRGDRRGAGQPGRRDAGVDRVFDGPAAPGGSADPRTVGRADAAQFRSSGVGGAVRRRDLVSLP